MSYVFGESGKTSQPKTNTSQTPTLNIPPTISSSSSPSTSHLPPSPPSSSITKNIITITFPSTHPFTRTQSINTKYQVGLSLIDVDIGDDESITVTIGLKQPSSLELESAWSQLHFPRAWRILSVKERSVGGGKELEIEFQTLNQNEYEKFKTACVLDDHFSIPPTGWPGGEAPPLHSNKTSASPAHTDDEEGALNQEDREDDDELDSDDAPPSPAASSEGENKSKDAVQQVAADDEDDPFWSDEQYAKLAQLIEKNPRDLSSIASHYPNLSDEAVRAKVLSFDSSFVDDGWTDAECARLMRTAGGRHRKDLVAITAQFPGRTLEEVRAKLEELSSFNDDNGAIGGGAPSSSSSSSAAVSTDESKRSTHSNHSKGGSSAPFSSSSSVAKKKLKWSSKAPKYVKGYSYILEEAGGMSEEAEQKSVRWTEDEIKLLKKLFKRFPNDLGSIMSSYPKRSISAVHQRIYAEVGTCMSLKIKQPNHEAVKNDFNSASSLKKEVDSDASSSSKWTEDEFVLLKKLLTRFPDDIDKIASHFPGRAKAVVRKKSLEKFGVTLSTRSSEEGEPSAPSASISRDRWTKDEYTLLKKLLDQSSDYKLDSISARFPTRTKSAVLKKCKRKFGIALTKRSGQFDESQNSNEASFESEVEREAPASPFSVSSKWTEEETARLGKILKQFPDDSLDSIAARCPTRTTAAVREKSRVAFGVCLFQRGGPLIKCSSKNAFVKPVSTSTSSSASASTSGKPRFHWSKEEDARLMELVELFPSDLDRVCAQFTERSKRAIQERIREKRKNHLKKILSQSGGSDSQRALRVTNYNDDDGDNDGDNDDDSESRSPSPDSSDADVVPHHGWSEVDYASFVRLNNKYINAPTNASEIVSRLNKRRSSDASRSSYNSKKAKRYDDDDDDGFLSGSSDCAETFENRAAGLLIDEETFGNAAWLMKQAALCETNSKSQRNITSVPSSTWFKFTCAKLLDPITKPYVEIEVKGDAISDLINDFIHETEGSIDWDTILLHPTSLTLKIELIFPNFPLKMSCRDALIKGSCLDLLNNVNVKQPVTIHLDFSDCLYTKIEVLRRKCYEGGEGWC